MAKPTRADLLKLLQTNRTLPQDSSLLLAVAEYLTDTFDVEVLESTERSFGAPMSTLRQTLQRHTVAEFQSVWPGTCKWLKEYMVLTEKNEAPSIYHALSALQVASSAMGRKYFVDMRFFRIYPPLAVILVGPSGLRKTTAINTALKLVKNIGGLTVVQEKVTPEALIETIRPVNPLDDANGLLVAPEMSVTFGKAQYLQGFVPLITRLLDHDTAGATTRGKGKIEVERVAFGVLAGTTLPWITEEMNLSVVSGGFTSRFLISYEKASNRVFFRSDTFDHAKLALLRTELTEQLATTGEVQISKQAEHLMEEWYQVHKERTDIDDLQSGWHNRKQIHLIRLAMIFAVLKGKRQIDRMEVLEAGEVLRYLEPGMFQLYDELGRPTTALDSEKILNLLKLNDNELPRREVLRTLGKTIPHARLREALDYLVESEQIEIDTKSQSVRIV